MRRSPFMLLAALILAYVMAFIDRQIPALLIEPLKADLHVTDVQVSLLYGLSFALMMSLAGIPLGMLADRHRRLTIIATGVVVSSACTAASGLVGGFSMLLLCRALIGFGQAALTPASHSLIADSFPRERVGLVLGIYGVAPYLGTGIAYLVGAAAIDLIDGNARRLPFVQGLQPWQMVFLAVGLPGLLLALWLAVLPERRDAADPAPSEIWDMPAIGRFLRAHGDAFLFLKFATAFASMAVYGVTAWYPSLLIRRFGWSAAQAGATLGPMMMAIGMVGAIAGGATGDRAARAASTGRLRVMALASLLAAPFAMAAPLTNDAMTGLALLAPALLLSTVVIAINPAATMVMMPARMRGLASGLGVLIVNLVGFGLGPMMIAAATDYGWRDPVLVHYALATLLPMMLVAASACAFAGIAPYARCLSAQRGALSV